MGLAKPIAGTPLDPAHPLTRGLLAAFVPQSAVRFVDPCGALWIPANGPTRAPGRTGAAIAYNGVDQVHTNDTIVLPTTACTVALLLFVPASPHLLGSTFGSRDKVDSTEWNSRVQAHIPANDETVYWDYGGVVDGITRLFWTPDPGWFGAWHTLVFRAGLSGSSIWADGEPMASQGTTAIARVNRNLGFSVGAWAAEDALFCNPNTIEALFLAGREWSDGEIRAWSADTYAMFLRQSPSRFFVPSAGGPFPSFSRQTLVGGMTVLRGGMI